MTERELIKQLKALKITPEAGTPTSAEVERMHGVIMARIGGTAPQPLQKTGFAASLGFYARFIQFITPPRFAYAIGVFVLLAAAGVVAAASRGALPGDSLYGAKLALEKTQVRFVSNPADRARVQMEFAGNRLREIQTIQSQTPQGEPNGRVDEALTRFAKDVQEAAKTLKEAGDPVQVKAAATEIVQKAVQYKQELAKTKEILEDKAVVEKAPEVEVVEIPIAPQEPTEFTVEQPVRSRSREVGLASIEQAEKALTEVEQAVGD